MDCADYRDRIAALVDGVAADAPDDPALEAHLAACPECRARAVVGAARPKPGPGPAPAPDPEVGRRVRLGCAYCKDALPRAGHAVYCAACLTPHHADCFAAHGACSAPGCGETRSVTPGAAAAGARSPRRRRRPARAAVAALGAVLVIGGVLLARDADSGDGRTAATDGPESTAPAVSPAAAVAASPKPSAASAAPRPAAPGAAPAPDPSAPLRVAADLERGALFDPARPVHAVVSLEGAPLAGGPRPPAEVALVVDCSGSMGGGEKIGYARQAAQAFLEGLRPGDAACVVGFSDAPRTVVPWTPAADLVPTRAGGLAAGGGTNMIAALEAGIARVASAATAEGPDAIRRVVLLTDGRPNGGDADREPLVALARAAQAQGISVSCHGFGQDVDAALLTAVAEAGGGAYLYVDRGELALRAFELELAQVLSIVAARTEVRIEPAPGVEVEEVVSWSPEADGAARVVRVGDVPAEARRKVVVRLKWSTPAVRDGRVVLGRVRWAAVRADDGERCAGEAPLVADVAADEAEALASRDPRVAPDLAEAAFALRVDEARARLAAGDVAGAQALGREAYMGLIQADPDAATRLRARHFALSDAAQDYLEAGAVPEDAEAARVLLTNLEQASR